MILDFQPNCCRAIEIREDMASLEVSLRVEVAGGEEENKTGGKNVTALDSGQINPRPLHAPTATPNCPTNSSGEQTEAGRSPLM